MQREQPFPADQTARFSCVFELVQIRNSFSAAGSSETNLRELLDVDSRGRITRN